MQNLISTREIEASLAREPPDKDREEVRKQRIWRETEVSESCLEERERGERKIGKFTEFRKRVRLPVVSGGCSLKGPESFRGGEKFCRNAVLLEMRLQWDSGLARIARVRTEHKRIEFSDAQSKNTSV